MQRKFLLALSRPGARVKIVTVGANGGDALTSGGGGGGRIAISADTDTFSGAIQALGGSGYEDGEPGTTYLESPLIAGFTAAPQSGTAPLTVTFTNTTTGDVTAYEWAFGDGATSVITHPTHVYTTTGVYTVSLTATGPGISDTLTRTNYITVTSAAGEPVTITRVITYILRQTQDRPTIRSTA